MSPDEFDSKNMPKPPLDGSETADSNQKSKKDKIAKTLFEFDLSENSKSRARDRELTRDTGLRAEVAARDVYRDEKSLSFDNDELDAGGRLDSSSSRKSVSALDSEEPALSLRHRGSKQSKKVKEPKGRRQGLHAIWLYVDEFIYAIENALDSNRKNSSASLSNSRKSKELSLYIFLALVFACSLLLGIGVASLIAK